MYKYTLCFIRQANRVLMLNREKSPRKGLWNGVGGKAEEGETLLECVIRETREETGIVLTNAVYKGIISWEGQSTGGMFVFVADLPEDYEYHTPRKIGEGILDWKEIDWIFSEKNLESEK